MGWSIFSIDEAYEQNPNIEVPSWVSKIVENEVWKMYFDGVDSKEGIGA